MLSPPLDMKAKWFEHSTAYTMAKFGMSMCVLGLAGELKSSGVAVNAPPRPANGLCHLSVEVGGWAAARGNARGAAGLSPRSPARIRSGVNGNSRNRTPVAS